MPSRSSSMAPPLLHRHHDLQGPRPAPLNVIVSTAGTTTTGTDLLGVNKRRRLHQQAPPPRQPVIIYVESPRVVHAHPGEFKSVVQRLTGAPAPPPPPTMVFPASSSAPPQLPLQLQFPFQFPLLGAAGSAGALLPLTSSVMSVVTVAETSSGGGSPVHQQLANHRRLLVSSDGPFDLSPPPSLAAAYCHPHHGGDLFVDHHH